MSRAEKAMRRDWDDRAKKNAFYYIEDSRSDWDDAAFFESGERDYKAFVEPALAELGFDPTGKAMLELGCGAGRMTRSFIARFSKVCAVDISAEMIARGKTLLENAANMEWLQGNGKDLREVTSVSMDFVFSYIVLQHLPAEELTATYVSEILRVLKPGGVFLFQFNSLPVARMNFKGRIAWGLLDAMWSAGMVNLSRKAGAAMGLDPLAVGKAWRGASVPSSSMKEYVQRSGGQVLGITGDGTNMTWCRGTKR